MRRRRHPHADLRRSRLAVAAHELEFYLWIGQCPHNGLNFPWRETSRRLWLKWSEPILFEGNQCELSPEFGKAAIKRLQKSGRDLQVSESKVEPRHSNNARPEVATFQRQHASAAGDTGKGSVLAEPRGKGSVSADPGREGEMAEGARKRRRLGVFTE